MALATALNRTLVSADEALVRYQLLFRQSRSSSIALTGDDNRAVVVNRQKASVSVIRVRNTDGSDASQLLAEIPVGKEPRFVAHRAQRQPRLRDQRHRRHHERHRPHGEHAGGARQLPSTWASSRAVSPSRRTAPMPSSPATPRATWPSCACRTTKSSSRVHTGGNPYAIAISNDGDATTTTSACTSRSSSAKSSTRRGPTASTMPSRAWSVRSVSATRSTNAGTAPVTRLLLKPMARVSTPTAATSARRRAMRCRPRAR